MESEITPKTLNELAEKKYGKRWHNRLALKIGVHRTTVLRWASGTVAIKPWHQAALRRHFKVR